MTTFGFSLMCELHHPRDLVQQAQRAEAAGFDFVTISDHFHPWLYSHGHSPYAWSVLGGVAATTKRLRMMTLVTCPTIRYHPAIVAQKAATMGAMSGGRFELGLGAGENLNEHVGGQGWPPARARPGCGENPNRPRGGAGRPAGAAPPRDARRIDRGDPQALGRRLRHA